MPKSRELLYISLYEKEKNVISYGIVGIEVQEYIS